MSLSFFYLKEKKLFLLFLQIQNLGINDENIDYDHGNGECKKEKFNKCLCERVRVLVIVIFFLKNYKVLIFLEYQIERAEHAYVG
jgi:hypothetical protein